MRKTEIHQGQKFGRLTAVRELPDRMISYVAWEWRCDCGRIKAIRAAIVRSGATKSCGCLQKERASAASTRHGQSDSPEHISWMAMKARVLCKTNPNYVNYGGRGITVCERWLEFENFLADMGKRPSPEHSIERVNNDGNYCPENCKWATHIEQNRNTRHVRNLALGGRVAPVTVWAEALGISDNTIRGRLRDGWTLERTLTSHGDQRFSKPKEHQNN